MAGAFFATAFFLAGAFFAAAFFLAGAFFAAGFLAGAFLAEAFFFAGAFLAAVFRLAMVMCFLLECPDGDCRDSMGTGSYQTSWVRASAVLAISCLRGQRGRLDAICL